MLLSDQAKKILLFYDEKTNIEYLADERFIELMKCRKNAKLVTCQQIDTFFSEGTVFLHSDDLAQYQKALMDDSFCRKLVEERKSKASICEKCCRHSNRCMRHKSSLNLIKIFSPED